MALSRKVDAVKNDLQKIGIAPSGDRPELVGNVKVTRQDWLAVAMDVLISDGVEQVKILTLGERLGVSRSSFYWYFSSRQDLLNALLDHWENANTKALVKQAGLAAETITESVCNVFSLFHRRAAVQQSAGFCGAGLGPSFGQRAQHTGRGRIRPGLRL